MPLNQWLSLLSVVFMAIAFWCSHIYLENENLVFIFQIIGYLLLAASSWLIHVHAAAFVLVLCAVTLTLKMLRRLPGGVTLPFVVVALIGGLILNNSGWIGVLPVLAGTGVIYRHAFRHTYALPLGMPRNGSFKGVDQFQLTMLDKMDNAYRYESNALGLFLYNIVGVIMWGAYAWLVGDWYMTIWRGVMLLFNIINYAKRIWPPVSRMLARVLPNPDRNKRRKYAGKRNKRDWFI